ncbi:MAG: DUF4827 domain-containing protein [Prevotella sp.]|nr:DUF4827 domain-containing protein [Prevotella sp.]
MKKFLLIIIAAVAVLASCNDYETYGDLKEKERNAISKFIADSSITVISEDQFVQQGNVTKLERNEFVKLDKSGVYMQIVREGCGEKIKDGDEVNLCCRFKEYNIKSDTLTLENRSDIYSAFVDVMHVTRTSGTFTAYFTTGMMYIAYSSASVPAGWLVPLSYIKVGRPQSMTDEISKVRLIVPHTQGHATASSNVVPYYYEITFEKEA